MESLEEMGVLQIGRYGFVRLDVGRNGGFEDLRAVLALLGVGVVVLGALFEVCRVDFGYEAA